MPTQLSTFIGREREIAKAKRLLNGTRLLTLTGPGGNGKTRLALEVAEGLARRYRDGVSFVDLAPLSDPEFVPQAVATALNLREAPGRPLVDTLVGYLKTRQVLLLLDNCEHLIAACAELAFVLLTSCPGVRVVATSREPLHVTGETVWSVPPLALPELNALPALDELTRNEAIRLLVERAGRIAPGFTLNEQNALPISQICCWVGGSPLAIELAAARLRVLSPQQIAARLEHDLALLATGDRTAPPRHRTLQATLDWSYDLLSAGEQSLFRCLSVFASSFSLEAAEAVCAVEECGESAPAVVDLLTSLVDKSLLEVEGEAGSQPRYRYLAPVRQYALAKLEQVGGGEPARERLLAWAVAVAEKTGPETLREQAKTSVEELELEHTNLRAALEWSTTQPARILERYRLAIALSQFWQVRGYIGEGTAFLEPLASGRGAVPVRLQIDALQNSAFMSIHAGEFARARRDLERGLELAQGLEDQYGMPWLFQHMAFLTVSEGDLERAARLCEDAIEMHRQAGDAFGQAAGAFLRANIAYLQGEYGVARGCAEESQRICESLGYRAALARRKVRLGQICRALGDAPAAGRYMTDALSISRAMGDNWGIAMALVGMTGLAYSQGQPERGAWLLGVTRHYLTAFGGPLWKVDQVEYDRHVAALKARLGDEALQAAVDRGAEEAARDLDRALGLALDERERGQRTSQTPVAVAPRPLPAKEEPIPLSRREREVAALIARGKSNAEIAAALFVGLRTVEAHVTHILNKLGFNSRAQIAAWVATHSTSVAPDTPRRTRNSR